MARPIIDIGMRIDISDQIADIEKQLNSLANKAGGKMTKEVSNQIAALESELKGLQDSFAKLNTSKLSSKTFQSATKEITSQIAELDKRTTALETGMTELIRVMSATDGGIMEKALKQVSAQMEAVKKNAQDATKAVGDMVSSFEGSANVRISTGQDEGTLKKELKELQQLSQAIGKIREDELYSPYKGSVEEYIKEIEALYSKYNDIMDKMGEENLDVNAYSSLRSELIKTSTAFSTLYNSIPDNFFDTVSGKKFSGTPFVDIAEIIKDDLSALQLEISSRIDAINTSLANIGQGVAVDNVKNKLTVPLDISTSQTTLLKRAKDIVDSVQPYLNNYPLKVQFILQSGYSSKKTNSLLSQMQKEISELPDEVNKSGIQELYDKIAKDFNKELNLRISADALEPTEKKITTTIERIRKTVQEPMKITPEIVLDDTNVAEVQSQLNKISKKLSLNVDKLELSVNAQKTAKNSSTVKEIKESNQNVKIANESIDAILAKISEVEGSLSPITKLLLDIRQLLQLLPEDVGQIQSPINEITTSVRELTSLLQSSIQVLSSEDLDGMFTKIQRSVNSISGSLRGKNLDKIKDILAEFKKYRALGGTSSITDLGGADNVQNWLKKHYLDSNVSKNNVVPTENSELSALLDRLNEISEAIVKKTNLFEEEKNSVTKYVPEECEKLNTLGDVIGVISNNLTTLNEQFKTRKLTTWGDKFKDVINEIASLINGTFGNGDISKILDEWIEADRIMRNQFVGERGMFTNSKTGWRSNAFTYDKSDEYALSSKIYDYTSKLADTYIHSHGNDIQGLFSIIEKDGDEYAGDLLKAYYDYTKGIHNQIVTGLGEGQIFDAKAFFGKYGDINAYLDSIDEGHSQDASYVPIREQLINAKNELVSSLDGNFSEFVSKYGSLLPDTLSKILSDNDISDDGKLASQLKSAGFTNFDEYIFKLYRDSNERATDIINNVVSGMLASNQISYDADELSKYIGENIDSLLSNIEQYIKYSIRDLLPDIMKVAGIDDYSSYITPISGGNIASLMGNSGATSFLDSFIKKISEARTAVNELADASQRLGNDSNTGSESKAMTDLANSSEKASEGKKQFAAANAEVIASIIAALKSIDSEGKAFENLSKIITKFSGKNGQSNADSTVQALERIRDVLKTPVDDNSMIKALENIASQGANLEHLATVLKASKKQLEKAQEVVSTGKSDSKFDNSISSYVTSALKKIDSAVKARANQATSYTQEFTNQITIAEEQLQQLNDIIKNHPSDTPWDESEIANIKEMQSQIDKVVSGLTDQSNINETTTALDKLSTRISKTLNDNTKMSSELRNAFIDLRKRIDESKESIDKVSAKKLIAEFQALNSELEKSGKTGKSFWTQISKAITSQSAQFVATYLSFQDIIRYAREVVTTVTEIDSALTELRKVSDASTERLAQNFETSAKTAKELGASITHVINVTADWARLGYDVDAAEELARVTTLFTTVGDNMTSDDASSYMISTLQGFQLATEEAERIVDVYNEVECCLHLQ